MTEPSQSTFSQQIVNCAGTCLFSELSVRDVPMGRVPQVHFLPDAPVHVQQRFKTLYLIFREGLHFGRITECWDGHHLEDL